MRNAGSFSGKAGEKWGSSSSLSSGLNVLEMAGRARFSALLLLIAVCLTLTSAPAGAQLAGEESNVEHGDAPADLSARTSAGAAVSWAIAPTW